MKKILILEDNVITQTYLLSLINEIEMEKVVLTSTSAEEAYQYAVEKNIDLFLVDIILNASRPGDASGLKFVDNIRKIQRYVFTPVIFVSSLEDEKLYTYEKLHCYSFIEKPFNPEKLKVLVRECLSFPKFAEARKTLFFRKEGIILAVEREDIVYAESVNHVMSIYTKQGDVLKIPYITLKKLLEEADSPDIIQCSRSTVVNKNFVHNVDIPNQIIQLKEGLGKVEIGIMYKKQLKEMFK